MIALSHSGCAYHDDWQWPSSWRFANVVVDVAGTYCHVLGFLMVTSFVKSNPQRKIPTDTEILWER